MNNIEFKKFPSIARLSREIVITEKIDGTNAQVYVSEDGQVFAGSRSRWITPDDDNYGFARWVEDNKGTLVRLGPGHHYGEWWGAGIQVRYGLSEKRFSLFNVSRWDECRPACCHVVPTLYRGEFSQGAIDDCLAKLVEHGSVAAPGFMRPEGIVIFHTHSGALFKKTILNDDKGKSYGA